MTGIRHLFWDFDGTLYDSYPQMLHSVMSALDEIGLGSRFTADEVLKLIKVNVRHGLNVCAQRAGIDVQLLLEAYRKYHAQEMNFDPYDGLKECLETLHAAGFRHYLYTHRDQSAVRQLKSDDLWRLFNDSVIKEDGFPLKPAPDALHALMERNGLSPDVCAMVGDRNVDIDAGHNAGMSGILFDPEGFYAGYPAEIQVTTFAELTEKLM